MAKKNLEREERRKIQIVQAAYEVIATKGYNNFTIEDIANQAGLSKGGVLHYFKTKEDILIHLLEQIYMIIEKTIRKRAEKYQSPERKIKAIIIGYVTIAKKQPAFYRVMADFWAQITINERIRDINTKIFEKMSNEFKKVIDMGKEQALFGKVDSSGIAYAITAMLINTAMQWTFNSAIYNIDHVGRQCIRMVMSYLTRP
ncbi:MAG TPA: TetR/AcrR family transcriptional regulator [Spirochaetota bacterium]|nr:TetR/AcrR family transcriptional regulator [Spirochaetota bacterium]HNT11027.1 TetR/AcrR family transcriptional regulator [Spirochaetota bacterium]HNV48138.1 TetR/AcrR family transcriptional regulator [Spirochaetota bacterium]HOS40474.1 TetR/AcrR family transcriptional regulator [Spirochaetota bacterium]HPU90446.1 TetR/AcrR family transcriptional regulator [Spirochaetota bacterium]